MGPPRRTATAEERDGVIRATCRTAYGSRFAHAEARVAGADRLDDLQLQHAAAEAYRLIRRALQDGPAQHPVRFWNFIPGIVDAAADARLDRYMVFNAGRYAALADWFHAGDREQLAPHIATATGVGHPDADLVVHALADRHPGTPVENPRQRAAYRYSKAYGPLPPCFARATVVDLDAFPPLDLGPGRADHGGRCVLVGGTSSIVGESSVHAGDVAAQTHETLDNIDALLRHAGAHGVATLKAVRVYVVDPAYLDTVTRVIDDRLKHLAQQPDLVLAPLCRRDLGVEIEGLARVG
ncbi:MAG: Rid family hydrolase [Planctomycetota bacterium]